MLPGLGWVPGKFVGWSGFTGSYEGFLTGCRAIVAPVELFLESEGKDREVAEIERGFHFE